MDKDSKQIFEAFETKWKQTSMDPKQAEAEFGKENVRVTPKGLRSGQDMVEVNVPDDDVKSPFHYDPMHGLASAAHKIKDELQSAANDEARPEHIEKMAEIILGPQSEYASSDHYQKALSGIIELLNHYVMVEMN